MKILKMFEIIRNLHQKVEESKWINRIKTDFFATVTLSQYTVLDRSAFNAWKVVFDEFLNEINPTSSAATSARRQNFANENNLIH